MKVIKKNRNLVVFLFLLFGWFYWFQVRPEIKLKECQANVKEKHTETWNDICSDKGGGNDCKLPSDVAKRLTDLTTENLDRCIKVWN